MALDYSATGPTIELCVKEMREALGGHSDVMRERGKRSRHQSAPGVYVERAVAA